MIVEDALRANVIHTMLHVKTLPEEGHEIPQGALMGFYRERLRPSLNLCDHGDRRLRCLIFRQIVAQERAIPYPFPSDVEIEGDSSFRVPFRNRVVHVSHRYRPLR